MRGLPPASVDACITDPPYGTTACAWDSVIPFAPMWAELKRIVKPKGAIVLFGSQPFTSALVMSNPAMFKYEIVWDKGRGFQPQLANVQPMKSHENVLLFGRERFAYNPQMTPCKPYSMVRRALNRADGSGHNIFASSPQNKTYNALTPISVVFASFEHDYHPTQKPIDLLRYLVRTYTNAGDTVLDFTCGSGTTGVACEIEGRNSINIDSDGHYCDVARARITRASGIAADIPRRVKEYPPTPLFEAVA